MACKKCRVNYGYLKLKEKWAQFLLKLLKAKMKTLNKLNIIKLKCDESSLYANFFEDLINNQYFERFIP